MKKAIVTGIACGILFQGAFANEYHKNVQVFTANTAKIPCKTSPRFVYKGDRKGYAEQISKTSDNAVFSALVGLGQGAAVGAGVFAVLAVTEAATGDYEYLYVTECNSGEEKTRLMTLVVSNNSMSESQWTALAKKDQARSR